MPRLGFISKTRAPFLSRLIVANAAAAGVVLASFVPAHGQNPQPPGGDIDIPSPVQDYTARDYLDALWHLEHRQKVRRVQTDESHEDCDVQTFQILRPGQDEPLKTYIRILDREERDHCTGEVAEELHDDVQEEVSEDEDMEMLTPYRPEGGGTARYSHFDDWRDTTGNGVESRHEVFWRDMEDLVWDSTGRWVISGSYTDPYTGERTHYPETETHADHVYPVSQAWFDMEHRSQEERIEYYHDPMNLLTTTGEQNMTKLSELPHNWMPPDEDFHCTYAMIWTRIMAKYDFSQFASATDELTSTLERCILEAAEAAEIDSPEGILDGEADSRLEWQERADHAEFLLGRVYFPWNFQWNGPHVRGIDWNAMGVG